LPITHYNNSHPSSFTLVGGPSAVYKQQQQHNTA
jgi:hypothetical protein